MDMPKIGPGHAQLARLTGEWSGDETVAPSPWGAGGPAHGRFSHRIELDGMALVQDYVEEKDGRTVFRAHGVFMLDPATGDTLWWWFDSLGFPPEPARGLWHGDSLLLEKNTPRGSARYRFDVGGGAFDFRIENRLGAATQFSEFMHGRYLRHV